MIKILRQVLVQAIERIDAGNSNIDQEECEDVIEYISSIINREEKLSVYQACKYLKISRSTFDNWVREGKLPKGRKQQGFKELFYYKKDLEKYRNAK